MRKTISIIMIMVLMVSLFSGCEMISPQEVSVDEAEDLVKDGEIDDAIDMYEEILDDDEEDHDAWEGLVNAYIEDEEWEDAAEVMNDWANVIIDLYEDDPSDVEATIEDYEDLMEEILAEEEVEINPLILVSANEEGVKPSNEAANEEGAKPSNESGVTEEMNERPETEKPTEQEVSEVFYAVDYIDMNSNEIEALLGSPDEESIEYNMRKVFYDELGMILKYDLLTNEVVSSYFNNGQSITNSIMLGEVEADDLMDIYSNYEYIENINHMYIIDGQHEMIFYSVEEESAFSTCIIEDYNPSKYSYRNLTYYMERTFDQIINEFGPYYQIIEEDDYSLLYYFGMPVNFRFRGGVEIEGDAKPYIVYGDYRSVVNGDYELLGETKYSIRNEIAIEFYQALEYPDYYMLFDEDYTYFIYFDIYDEVSNVYVHQHMNYETPMNELSYLSTWDYADQLSEVQIRDLQRYINYLNNVNDCEIYLSVTNDLYGMSMSEYSMALFENHRSDNTIGGYTLTILMNNGEYVESSIRSIDATADDDVFQNMAEQVSNDMNVYNDGILIAFWNFLTQLESFLETE